MGRLIDAYVSACDDYGLDGSQARTLWTLIRGQIIRAAIELGSLPATPEQMRTAYKRTGATPIRGLAELVARAKHPENSVILNDRPRAVSRGVIVGERELTFETGRFATHAMGSCFVTSAAGSALAWLSSAADPRTDGTIGVEIMPPRGDAPRRRELNVESIQRFLTVLMNRRLFDTTPQRHLRILGTSAAAGSNDVLALNAATGAAFMAGNLQEAIGTVRVAAVDGEYCFNPSADELERASLDLVITGTTAGIIALWGSGREIANATVLAAIDEARRPLRSICQTMDSLRRDLGRSAMDSPGPSPDAGMVPAATDLPDRKFLTETSVLPGSHGSALLSYGRTQVLASVLLSAERTKDAQMSFGLRGSEGRPIDVMRYEEFMTRAFAIVGPEEFPYSIACTMDVISLDTSFYAAAVAAASLAFFDAGIQLSSAVAAVTEVRVEENGPWVRATELQAGDLATVATIAGTRRGITALMLTSYDGVIDPNAIGSLLDRASNGRIELIDLMRETISAPRQELSQLAPRVVSLKVPRDRVRDVIGSAGKTLRWISEETGTKISVGESGDVVIEGSDQPRVERAAVIIEQLTAAPEIGRRYKGTIKRIEPYGAFVEILPGQDGLLHISEMAHGRIGQVTDLFALGDEIEVEVVSIEPDSGKIRLSRKPLLPPITEEELAEERSRADVPRRQRRQPRLPARDRDESDE